MAELQDQVAIVTGASRGIGRATGLALARLGATVVAAARSSERLTSLAAEAADLRCSGRVVVRPLDVTDAELARLRAPIGLPIGSKTPPEIKRLQPRLGEHSVEILKEAGYGAAEIDAMLKSGATKSA